MSMNFSNHTQQKTCVRDIMNNSVISIDSSVTAANAARMMEYTGIGAVIVLENNLPVGIVTDRDLAIKITAHSFPVSTLVRRIMSSPLISIDPTSDLSIASDLMSTRNVRKLPVIDDDKVVGILTPSDLLKYITNY